MSETIVIHGPQGCGKTVHAAALAAAFGCTKIIDEWNGADPLLPGVLALTNAPQISPPRRALVMRFDVAMDEAGLLRRKT